MLLFSYHFCVNLYSLYLCIYYYSMFMCSYIHMYGRAGYVIVRSYVCIYVMTACFAKILHACLMQILTHFRT